MGIDYLLDWIEDMDELLQKEEFDIREYHRMRRQFNDVIESTLDETMRGKLRDSWYSMGKALDKKAKRY
jgi:predicted secreted protein